MAVTLAEQEPAKRDPLTRRPQSNAAQPAAKSMDGARRHVVGLTVRKAWRRAAHLRHSVSPASEGGAQPRDGSQAATDTIIRTLGRIGNLDSQAVKTWSLGPRGLM
ncbi:MAG: hypothetical protein NVSMB26_18860 [Beijerinckiaceae bacterium]